MNFYERFKELSNYYLNSEIPENFTDIILDELGLDITARYGDVKLKNCVLVAPGQMTTSISQIEMIRESGFAGCVLKSVVAEDQKGHCSMIKFRRKPTKVETVYDDDDIEGVRPIIHWDGGLDLRNLEQYLDFAKKCRKFCFSHFTIIASILGHLPSFNEDFLEDEWVFTTKQLYDIGYRIFEIDFCPFLKEDDELMNKKTILRWYRVAPTIIKKVAKDIQVFPKIMNLDYGLDFQIQMIENAIQSSDGVVIGNRVYKKQYHSAHGGKELKEKNISQIKIIRTKYLQSHISGTGGIYSGKDVFDYINSGCENVQLLSFIMGKVKKPFKKKGNRFQQVFYTLMLDSENGYILWLLKQREKNENC